MIRYFALILVTTLVSSMFIYHLAHPLLEHLNRIFSSGVI
jgi:hypothetical protein